MDEAGALRISSPYVTALEAQRAALVAALAEHVTPARLAAARRESARLSVRLDASPMADATADAVDRGELPATGDDDDGGAGDAIAGAGARTGWAQVLRLAELPTQDIAAIEYRGVLAAQADEPQLAAQLFDTPLLTLAALHRRIARGLVAAERLGAVRRTTRAVHDGAQGMVVLQSPPPARLPPLLDQLSAWITTARGRVPPLALAGVVHARLLHWRPFEAGNGRVARAAARLALRAARGDPWGLSVPERSYAADPLGYVRAAAATARRGPDLRPWVEWTGEATVGSLEDIARGAGVQPPTVDSRAARVCARTDPGAPVTVADVAAAVGGDRAVALQVCGALCWAGVLRRDEGTRGLRYVRTDRPSTAW